MQQWKNFENRSIFGKDMGQILWLTFLGGHPVYSYLHCVQKKTPHAQPRNATQHTDMYREMRNGVQNYWAIAPRSGNGALSDDDVCMSVCLSLCRQSRMWSLCETFQTNQPENIGQCWDHESRLLDAILWHNHKSKTGTATNMTRSQAVARIADRRPTAKNCGGHVT